MATRVSMGLGDSPSGSAVAAPTDAEVRAELHRILASPLFQRSGRLSSFLSFIVEETLGGRGATLKEHVLAMEVHGKGPDFSAAGDPIVRVDARRLRDRLREYYESAPHDPIVISVPKGSYAPVFHARSMHGDVTVPATDVATPVAAPSRSRRSWRSWSAVAGLVVLAIALSTEVARRSAAPPRTATRVLTVTALPGSEEDPAFSPDGRYLAFSWASPSPGAWDIWIKEVDGSVIRQLTNTPDSGEKWPAWSPDGQHISFARVTNGRWAAYEVSPFGGPEHLIADGGVHTAWLPDSQSVVVQQYTPEGRSTLVHQGLGGGPHRVLTETPAGYLDAHPRVSPDGKTLAFQRYTMGRSGLYRMPVSGGEPRLIGEWSNGVMAGLAFTPDSSEILFARPELSGRRVYRVAADGRTAARVVEAAPHGAVGPALATSKDGRLRLALVSGEPDVGLRLVRADPGRAGTDPVVLEDAPFSDATRIDVPGRFSPDGSTITFVSDRSGRSEVWVARRDGSNLRTVATVENASLALGGFSPDGASIVFSATLGGSSDLHVVDLASGDVRRLTRSDASEFDPEWSRDGRWIYYVAEIPNESRSPSIWKMPAAGGAAVRLTTEPGFDPREAADGRAVYFLDRRRLYSSSPIGTLKQVPAGGGTVTTVIPRVTPGSWDVTDAGIVMLRERHAPSPSGADGLLLYDPASGKTRELGSLAFRVSAFGPTRYLVASRDAEWVLASHIDRWERDIIVVDGVR